MRSRAAASSNASSASVCADPTCSTCSTCRLRRVTTWTATAPEAVRTLRTNRETTTEGFHDEVLSDHIAPKREANQQVSGLGSRLRAEGGTSQARRGGGVSKAVLASPDREPENPRSASL